MIKEYFADGLLQIAIVLSLLRTDLDSFMGISYSRLRAYPELQETFLGSLSGFTQTDIHSRNRWNAAGLGGFVHPKSIDNFYSDSIFRDLHSLSHYQNFDGVERNLNTWLVNGPEPQLPRGQRSNEEVPSPGAGQTGEGGNSVLSNGEPEVEGAAVNIDFSSYFGSELTKEVVITGNNTLLLVNTGFLSLLLPQLAVGFWHALGLRSTKIPKPISFIVKNSKNTIQTVCFVMRLQAG